MRAKRHSLGLAITASLVWLAASVALAQQPYHSSSTLSIGLWTLWHDNQLAVSPSPGESATLRTCNAADAYTSSPLKQQTTIRADGNQLTIGEQANAKSIELTGSEQLAAHGESLTLHNPLRIAAHNGQLVMAVTLPIETYVERVVASESGPSDSSESLKALAIVVRTFALHQKHGHADYDLCDSTHCQLLHWGAPSTRASAAHAATLSTSGETLWFHSRRAAAWFHQNCGGHTASPTEVWPADQKSISTQTAMPWLISQADPYCVANGAREWSTTLSLAELTAALSNGGLVRPGWKTLTVIRRGQSGRAVTLRIGDSEVNAEDFRLAVGRALGWSKILSTWFEVSRQDSPANAPAQQFIFHGRGSGHGVGLCQAGSAAMASLGRTADQIIAQYFPGAAIAVESTGLHWQTLRAQGFTLQTLDASDATYLPQLNEALAHAQTLSGLNPTSPITIRAFHSTSAFRDATGAPGFTAAFTEGTLIATQSLPTLSSRKLLVPILTHEFLHALVEDQASTSTPLWLREGLVEAWSNANEKASSTTNAAPDLEALNHQLAHPTSAANSQAAHRAAAQNAKALLNRYGRDQVIAWLRTTLPPAIAASLR